MITKGKMLYHTKNGLIIGPGVNSNHWFDNYFPQNSLDPVKRAYYWPGVKNDRRLKNYHQYDALNFLKRAYFWPKVRNYGWFDTDNLNEYMEPGKRAFYWPRIKNTNWMNHFNLLSSKLDATKKESSNSNVIRKHMKTQRRAFYIPLAWRDHGDNFYKNNLHRSLFDLAETEDNKSTNRFNDNEKGLERPVNSQNVPNNNDITAVNKNNYLNKNKVQDIRN